MGSAGAGDAAGQHGVALGRTCAQVGYQDVVQVHGQRSNSDSASHRGDRGHTMVQRRANICYMSALGGWWWGLEGGGVEHTVIVE